jgi:hypothetical protein
MGARDRTSAVAGSFFTLCELPQTSMNFHVRSHDGVFVLCKAIPVFTKKVDETKGTVMSRHNDTHGGLPGSNAGGRNGATSDITAELLAAMVAATPAQKADALRVLKGGDTSEDAEAMRRRAGETERFLTLKECAKRLGLHDSTLWKWQVPRHMLGGRPKFRMSEIEGYLKSDAFQQRAAELRELDRAKRLRVQKMRQAIPVNAELKVGAA